MGCICLAFGLFNSFIFVYFVLMILRRKETPPSMWPPKQGRFYIHTNFLVLLDKPFSIITFLALPNWDDDIDLHASERGTDEPD